MKIPYLIKIGYLLHLVHCYMFINRWLLSNPLTKCLIYIFIKYICYIITHSDYVHLIYNMGHSLNNLGCFLLDLLPYRNKSDSLHIWYIDSEVKK